MSYATGNLPIYIYMIVANYNRVAKLSDGYKTKFYYRGYVASYLQEEKQFDEVFQPTIWS